MRSSCAKRCGHAPVPARIRAESARLIAIGLIVLTLISCESDSGEELIPPFEPYARRDGVDYLDYAALGDAGTGTVDQRLVASSLRTYALANPIAFIAYLGDNFYPAGVESVSDAKWESVFEGIYDSTTFDMPFYAVLGNHDYRGNILAQIDYVSPHDDRWQMQARYYSRSDTLPDSTVIDFFYLDTNSIAVGDEEQLQWLDGALSASNARWKIVIGHHVLYSFGQHGNNQTLINELQPLLDDRVDLYLAGHEHDMQILEPLSGVSYVVCGAGGDTRPTGVGDTTIMAVSELGFMGFLISGEELVCRVYDGSSRLLFSAVLKVK